MLACMYEPECMHVCMYLFDAHDFCVRQANFNSDLQSPLALPPKQPPLPNKPRPASTTVKISNIDMQLDVKNAIGSVKMAGSLHSRCALRSAESPAHPAPRHSPSFQTVLRNSSLC